MKSSLSLRKPINWQDFETLCKKLWGEIWNCPEIKKNGRSGQNQNGVDVYGKPQYEDGYYGIQCKGKDEYTNQQLSEKEIIEEIEKAKKFKPALKKLYFTTTANKDVKIEEFIRLKNLENIALDLFEVHVFSWEDIVELIDENKQTYDWYVKSINFKANNRISVTFQNNEQVLLAEPKFKQTITRYRKELEIFEAINAVNTLINNPLLEFAQSINRSVSVISISPERDKVNLSYIPVQILIKNTGNEPIEEYKIILSFEGEIQNIAKTNEIKTGLDVSAFLKSYSNTTISKSNDKGTIIPYKNILVGDDIYKSDIFFIKPVPQITDIIIKWKLISKSFKDEGVLTINVSPEIDLNIIRKMVDSNLEETDIESEIADYIIEKSNL